MARKYVRYNEKFKRETVRRMKTCPSVKRLAKELNIDRRLLYRWKEEFYPAPKQPAVDPSIAEQAQVGQLKQQVARLETALARKVLEADFFRDALQKVEARRRKQSPTGGAESTTRFGN